jgi:hypothetical protein
LLLNAGSGAAIARPTFSRDFAGEKTLDNGTGPAITFTRASDATFFDASGTLQTAANDTPRFDHDPATGASRGLLIEEARTNSITNSADLSNASWVKTSVSVTANTDVAPDGTTSADTVEDTTTGSTDNLITAAVSGAAANSQTWTWSFFIKKTTSAANYPAARLLFSGATAIQSAAVIDTNSGTITATGGSVLSFTASVQNAGNYWRVSCTGTNSATGNTNVSGRIHPAYNLDGTDTQDANATGSIVVWGGQLEQGAFPTSYIPTTTAAATRALDLAEITNIGSFYNASEGTMLAEYSGRPTNQPAFIFDDTTENQRLLLHTNASGITTFFVANSNTTQASIAIGSAVAATDVIKLIAAAKENDFQAAKNGTLGTADAAGTMPTVTRMMIGRRQGVGRAGHIRKVAYWPKRLTNTLLEQLTT